MLINRVQRILLYVYTTYICTRYVKNCKIPVPTVRIIYLLYGCLHIKVFFLPNDTSIPPASFLILHPINREIKIMWSQQ